MGFFVKDDAASPLLATAMPLPIDAARVRAVMEAAGWGYGVDDDGDLYTGFDGGLYNLLFYGAEGTYFQVRGRWRGVPTADTASQAQEFCAEWNRTRLFPKVYVDVMDDEAFLAAEYTVDHAAGATDEQIAAHLQCGIMTSEMFFEACAERFPQFAPAEQ